MLVMNPSLFFLAKIFCYGYPIDYKKDYHVRRQLLLAGFLQPCFSGIIFSLIVMRKGIKDGK